MQVDWKAILKTPKGDELKDGDKALTLGDFAYSLCLLHDPQANTPAADKLRNARLAKKIADEAKEISIDEAKVIKDLVGKYGSPASVLAVEDLLDPPKE